MLLTTADEPTVQAEAAERCGPLNASERASDLQDVLSRFRAATDEWSTYVLVLCGAVWGFLIIDVLIRVVEHSHRVSSFGSRGVGSTVFLIAFAGAVLWRKFGSRAAREQESALRRMRELAREDPLALETTLPELTRLTRSFVPKYGPSAAIARELIGEIEQARAASRDLPIAHAAGPQVQDDLPRAAKK